MMCDGDDVKKLITQLTRLEMLRVNTTLREDDITTDECETTACYHQREHELSPIPLSLAKHGGDMNSAQKSELISVLADAIHIPSAIPEANMKACMMIDGHCLIQALGKPHRCQATMLMCS